MWSQSTRLLFLHMMGKPPGSPFIFTCERQLHSSDMVMSPSSIVTGLKLKNRAGHLSGKITRVSPLFCPAQWIFSTAKRSFSCCSLGRVLKCSLYPGTLKLRCLKNSCLSQRQTLSPNSLWVPATCCPPDSHNSLFSWMFGETGHAQVPGLHSGGSVCPDCDAFCPFLQGTIQHHIRWSPLCLGPTLDFHLHASKSLHLDQFVFLFFHTSYPPLPLWSTTSLHVDEYTNSYLAFSGGSWALSLVLSVVFWDCLNHINPQFLFAASCYFELNGMMPFLKPKNVR